MKKNAIILLMLSWCCLCCNRQNRDVETFHKNIQEYTEAVAEILLNKGKVGWDNTIYPKKPIGKHTEQLFEDTDVEFITLSDVDSSECFIFFHFGASYSSAIMTKFIRIGYANSSMDSDAIIKRMKQELNGEIKIKQLKGNWFLIERYTSMAD